ncbi:hypothetical protein [Devosia ginsengisoli]|uniref:hypothetical protein n=1 Tax=Devosia ginsengisoli TaxID=400770 RepID=UPI0026F1B20E|nr:hypothetical protein [Devosia ginsengisoli]MCR6672158.1 hypothetical protein [Devosia ginsengisoli]
MTLSTCSSVALRAMLAASLILPTTAMAQDNPGWHGTAYEGMATLFYGTPQSDHAELSFSCEAGSGTATFVFAFAPIRAVDGVEVVVTLEAGDISLPIQTTGILLEMDDQFLLEGQVPLDAQLTDLLGSEGVLSVFVEDGSAEYSLDGAMEAATDLLETCGQDADTAAIEICEFDAWVQGSGPSARVIREGPSADAAAIADMPGPYEGYNDIAYPTVSITGSKDGWFRIDEVTTDRYADRDLIVAFTGEGWVPGKALALWVESPVLLEAPAGDAAIAINFSDGSHNLLTVDRLYACHGNWVEVGGTYGDGRVRGWSRDICESQITTCP